MTGKVIRELEAWRLSDGDDERRERIEAIRSYLNPEPAEAADPDREAMAKAAAFLETAPYVAERIVREHFAPAPRVTVRASGDWRKESARHRPRRLRRRAAWDAHRRRRGVAHHRRAAPGTSHDLGHKSDSSIPASFMRCFCRPRLSDASPCTGTEIRTTEPFLA